jgi:parvulin-like peptidyl-prolyl isomerase
MKSLSDEQKDEFITKAKRWHKMPEERREKLRAQMKKLREMPVDERMDLLDRAMENSESSEE